MPSQNTLVWVGAAASAVVVAGASALYWTHPGFLWRNLAGTPVVASAPAEPKAQSVPPAQPGVQTAPPAASAPEPGHVATTASAASPLEPAFDVVNVDRSGEAVIAGRAAPNAKVELRDAGKTVAEATADATGQFVIIPPALAPGDHSLSLAANAEKMQPVISSTVAVSVPAPEAKVAVSAPPPEGKAAAPAAPSASAPAPAPPAQAMRTVA
ncbi:MAG: Ig-like domain-containing protein, partial [Roseiarcus sp.]